MDNILTQKECQDLIQTCNRIEFATYQAGKNHHGALQLLVSHKLADRLGQALSRHVDLNQVEERRIESERDCNDDSVQSLLTYAGLNRRWRVYKYQAGTAETFAPHIDAGFPPSGLNPAGTELVWDTNNSDANESSSIVSRLTVLFYLNDDFVGGETKFYQPKASCEDLNDPQMIAAVQPKTGSCLVFPQAVGEEAVDYARLHWPLHEGAPVLSGSPKYVIRSDILFGGDTRSMTQTKEGEEDRHLFQYEDAVRAAFLPQNTHVLNRNFLSLIAHTYTPHMGVECMGPFLYSFLRFTKKRHIVEIGAGYTSAWILQALADNDAEMRRIQALGDEARLLDYPWVDVATVEGYCKSSDNEPAKLTTIDNCQHQKETATGAVAVAQQLGLGHYLDFRLGDAYEVAESFERDSIDVLWCDFGVGTRMKDFAHGAWASIRPGGFLICHSTLTNQRTREWLEAVRTRQSRDETGLPPDEYVELSLLEPHKLFQNSFSVVQKRKGYSEPLYSEFA